MKMLPHPQNPLTLAEKTGMLSIGLAMVLAFLHPFWSLIPLCLFLLVCAWAPFLSTVGFYLPVISRGSRQARDIALTFDDGPSPLSTPVVLKLLARHNLTATFFLIGKKAQQYPEIVKEILRQGHSIGNHSWNHDYTLMLRTQRTIASEVRKTQYVLSQLGSRPVFFRPPVGITGPRLTKVLVREQLTAVSANCRAYDRGNRTVRALAAKITRCLQPGCIILLHDIAPDEEDRFLEWQTELDRLLQVVSTTHTVVPLEELVNSSTENRC
ncbi:polysaccharide deacetylase family protein [Desulfogranum japonicum]|uniref:polysaccharide deacetylase family protein n=1 Tax=Desulfogranum japonicum TaxID=231447 RepID=UPI0006854BE3|nr:polysaccharide deacetylase family protein [Desulfogranum japonicum]